MNLIRWIKVIQKFFQQQFSHTQKPFIYVAIGDSTVEGVGASEPDRSYAGFINLTLQERYKTVEFHNLGKAYATVRDVIATQLEQAIAYNPDLITISVGANDIRKKTQLTQFEKDLQVLLSRLRAETAAEIVINTIPDVSLSPWVQSKGKPIQTLSKVLCWRLNQKIKKQALRSHIIVVDLYTQSRVFLKNYPESIASDDFHPSDFGYAIWANSILAHIPHMLTPKKRFWLFRL